MGKNKLSPQHLKKAKPSAEDKAEQEAARVMEGKAPWEDETKDARIPLRVEPSLKKAYLAKLPRFARASDVLRWHMERVARGEEEVTR